MSEERSFRDDHAVLAQLDFPTPDWVEADGSIRDPAATRRSRHPHRRTIGMIATVICLSLSIISLPTARGVLPTILLIAASIVWATTLAIIAFGVKRLPHTTTQVR